MITIHPFMAVQKNGQSNKNLLFSKLLSFLCFLLVGLFSAVPSNAQIFFTESFEQPVGTGGAGGDCSCVSTSVDVINGTGDYFARAKDSQINANGLSDYTGQDGTYYWASEDNDDPLVGGQGNQKLCIELTVNIVGRTNLMFSGLFGGNDSPPGNGYEPTDFLTVSYDIDGAGKMPLIDFRLGGNTMSLDANFDGTGDGLVILNEAMQTVSAAIPGTGNSMIIEICTHSNSTGEEFAFDKIQLFEDVPIICPSPGAVIITEIMKNPFGFDSQREWFEVYNTTNAPIDMMGWIIKDDDFDEHTINSSLIVPAMGHAVLGINDGFNNGGVSVDYEYDDFLLGNDDDEIVLECDGTEIDRVNYDNGINFLDLEGSSLRLFPTAYDAMSNDNGSNWCFGIPYYGPGGYGSPGSLNTARITYDNVCTASPLSIGSPFPVLGFCASPEIGEVSPPGTGCRTDNGWCPTDDEVQNSTWFTFVAPASGAVDIKTDGFGDTQIAVWEVGNCSDFGSFSLVAANDDKSTNNFNSRLTCVNVTPGNTYYIQVDGYDGEFYAVDLLVKAAANPINNDVCTALGIGLNVFVPADGSSSCVDAAPGEVSPGAGTGSSSCNSQDGWCSFEIYVQNSLWYTFTAPQTGQVDIYSDNADDTQMALYEVGDCSDFSSFTEIAANDDGGAGFSALLDNVCLTPGNTYYLQIDGFEGEPYNTNIIVETIGIPANVYCPANKTINCNESTDPANTGTATWNTNDCCPNAPMLSSNDVISQGNCPDNKSIARTWTATFDCGLVYDCVQTITVEDMTPPEITCPADVTLNCEDDSSPTSTGMATGSDNCDMQVDISFGEEVTPGNCPSNKTIIRTWKASDNCGKSVTCQQIITIEDMTDPVITCPANLAIACDESIAPANTGMATATDNCTMNIIPTLGDVTTPGSCPQTYSIARTWTAVDDCGLKADCVQTIEVSDQIGPSMTCVPATTLTPTADGNVTLTQAEIEALAAGTTDNCGMIIYTISQSYFNCQDEGLNQVTLTATDECNNANSCNIDITVEAFFTLVSTSATDESCEGAADGTISIEATSLGGQIGYSIDGGINFIFNNEFDNLTPGTYNIVVKVFGIPEICEATATEHVGSGSGSQTWYKDLDNDGYSDGVSEVSCSQPAGYKLAADLTATSGDCDDNDPDEYPGQTWYVDGDDDGYANGSVTSCNRPSATHKLAGELSGMASDCNDSDAAINPGATEVCDGEDNNCDGNADEGLSGETYVGNIAFMTQAELDAFPACYSVIDGDVNFSSTNISDLTPLGNIVEITGNFTLFYNASLTSLAGLENLDEVGGALSIYYNFALANCCAIDDLLTQNNYGSAVIFFNDMASHCNSEMSIEAACPIQTLITGPNSSVTNGQSIQLKEGSSMNLVPNPANQEVTVLVDRFANQATLRISDMLGRVIYETTLSEGVDRMTIPLDQGSFQNGIYLVTLIEEHNRTTQQLVIQH